MSEAVVLLALLADATVRGATPLVLAALGGLFAERSGVVDVGLEGKMLVSAFAAAAAAAVSGSAWAGLAAGIAASVLVALVHGFACVTHHGNQVVSGMALNITVSGLTVVLGYAWFQEGGQTPLLGPGARFGPIELPGAQALAAVPGLGLLYQEVVSGHNLLVYLAAAAVPLVAWLVYRTRFGLRLRAVGESPGAVDTAGISVAATRYRALVLGGLLCGVSGAYLSIAHHSSFIRDMSAGKGYLALAALIFGQWRPLPTLTACLLFSCADAVQARLQGTSLPLVGVVPVQLIQAIPYVLTVCLLAGFVGRVAAPRAIGVPYAKEGGGGR
jgi:simple sugar transport system permease protein